MEKQSNLDLAIINPNPTLTFSVGPLLIQETPALKLLYEDEEGLAYVHSVDNKLVLHSHYKVPKTMDTIKKARQISMLIDEMFKERGVKYHHTWATSEEEEKYNEFLGYVPTGYAVTIEGYKGPEIIEYYKEL